MGRSFYLRGSRLTDEWRGVTVLVNYYTWGLMLLRGLLGVLLLATTFACGEAASDAEGAIAEWEVAAEPRLAVGDVAERDTLVFGRISDARLLEGGMLVVADAGASGVRVFGADGELVSSAGRRGRGPGEFTGSLGLADAPGDSVAVWDAGQWRWSVVDGLSGGVRNVTGAAGRAAWIHAGILIRSALASPPVWVPPLLSALSAASPEVRLAHLDEKGLLFVSQDAAASRWLVYADSGSAIAQVTMPAGVSPFQFLEDAVVGVVADSLGLERVVVHALSRGTHRAPDLTPAAPLPVDSLARGSLMAALRNAVVAQEVHWMTAQAYTAHADSLQVAMPEGARFRVLEATKRGWRGVGWFEATGYTCGMIIGMTPPIGWSEGEVRCGWG